MEQPPPPDPFGASASPPSASSTTSSSGTTSSPFSAGSSSSTSSSSTPRPHVPPTVPISDGDPLLHPTTNLAPTSTVPYRPYADPRIFISPPSSTLPTSSFSQSSQFASSLSHTQDVGDLWRDHPTGHERQTSQQQQPRRNKSFTNLPAHDNGSSDSDDQDNDSYYPQRHRNHHHPSKSRSSHHLGGYNDNDNDNEVDEDPDGVRERMSSSHGEWKARRRSTDYSKSGRKHSSRRRRRSIDAVDGFRSRGGSGRRRGRRDEDQVDEEGGMGGGGGGKGSGGYKRVSSSRRSSSSSSSSSNSSSDSEDDEIARSNGLGVLFGIRPLRLASTSRSTMHAPKALAAPPRRSGTLDVFSFFLKKKEKLSYFNNSCYLSY